MQFLFDEFKNDKEIVLEAIKNDGSSIWCASKEIKNNKKMVADAIKNYSCSLKYASEELQNDKNLIIRSLKSLYLIDHIKFKRKNKKFNNVINIDRISLKKSFVSILKFY